MCENKKDKVVEEMLNDPEIRETIYHATGNDLLDMISVCTVMQKVMATEACLFDSLHGEQVFSLQLQRTYNRAVRLLGGDGKVIADKIEGRIEALKSMMR